MAFLSNNTTSINFIHNIMKQNCMLQTLEYLFILEYYKHGQGKTSSSTTYKLKPSLQFTCQASSLLEN